MADDTDIASRLRNWREPPAFHFTDDDHLEGMCGSDIRHKSGAQPVDYLKAFLLIARNFGYATRDGSWGELEKILNIAFRNQVRLMRQAKEAADLIERQAAEIARLRAEVERLRGGLRAIADNLSWDESNMRGAAIGVLGGRSAPVEASGDRFTDGAVAMREKIAQHLGRIGMRNMGRAVLKIAPPLPTPTADKEG